MVKINFLNFGLLVVGIGMLIVAFIVTPEKLFFWLAFLVMWATLIIALAILLFIYRCMEKLGDEEECQ